MRVVLLLVGKTKHDYLETGISDYLKRIGKFVTIMTQFVPELRVSAKMPAQMIREREGEGILKKLKHRDTVVLLDERGTAMSSERFADFLNKRQIHSSGTLVFIIGGANGCSEAVYQRADYQISLSKMTFSHQIIRLLFLEQLYRAYTIIRKEPYHIGH